MKDNVTVNREAPVCKGASKSRMGPALLAVALLLGGCAGGIYWERSSYSPAALWGLIRGSTTVSESVRNPIVSEEPAEPDALEARLTEQIRSLHTEIARLDEEAKEGRIHYNLLLQRGYDKDDTVCVSLVARQQEIKERITELKDSAREAEALRQRLVATIQELAESGRMDGVDESLRADVLRLIYRAGLQDTTSTVIPDAAWVEPGVSEGIGKINEE